MNALMRSVLLATMMAGGLGLVACNSSTTELPPQDDTGDVKPDVGNQDVGVDTSVVADTGKDVGVDTNPDTDGGVDADTGGPPPLDPDASVFLDPDHIPNTDQVIVGTLAIPTGPELFKYVAFWADPNEAVFTNTDGTDGFHAYELLPVTEQVSRSHDHSMWVYSSGTSRDYGARLLVVDQDGKGQRLLKDDTLYQDHCKEYLPEFSPNGDWVYYWRSCEVTTSDYPGIISNHEFQFRARVVPKGTADDVQPFVAKNVLEPSIPGSPSAMLFGHLNDDGSKFVTQQISSTSAFEGVIYSIDTASMIGTKMLDLAKGFDLPNTNGPGYIHQFVMPANGGVVYFEAKYSDLQNGITLNTWKIMKMAFDGTLSPAFTIPMDSQSMVNKMAYSLSPLEQDRFTYIGTTRFTPEGKALEFGLGISGIAGTGVKFSDQRGTGGRFTSWNP